MPVLIVCSNNSDNINTSNNAILALTAAKKAATGDAASGKRSTSAQTMPTTTTTASTSTDTNTSTASSFKCSSNSNCSNRDDDTVNNDVNYDGNTYDNDNNDHDDDDGDGEDITDDGSTTNRPRRGSLEPGCDDCDDVTSTTATLSVKNLDESITDEKLESLFSVYGHVVSAKVWNQSLGTAGLVL